MRVHWYLSNAQDATPCCMSLFFSLFFNKKQQLAPKSLSDLRNTHIAVSVLGVQTHLTELGVFHLVNLLTKKRSLVSSLRINAASNDKRPEEGFCLKPLLREITRF